LVEKKGKAFAVHPPLGSSKGGTIKGRKKLGVKVRGVMTCKRWATEG